MKMSAFTRERRCAATLLTLLATVACAEPQTPTAPFVGDLTPSFAELLSGRGDGPVIFVTSQGLYYDSIVTADPLPMHGPFQKLEVTSNGLQTEYGPGDPGYVGGRWWVDSNGDGEMDAEDAYFSCPLLGPGRVSP